MKRFIFAVAFLALAGCTDSTKATRVLEQQGFKEINITGYSPFACSDSDTFSTGFEATSPNGSRVRGTVCSGILKGATVRFD